MAVYDVVSYLLPICCAVQISSIVMPPIVHERLLCPIGKMGEVNGTHGVPQARQGPIVCRILYLLGNSCADQGDLSVQSPGTNQVERRVAQRRRG